MTLAMSLLMPVQLLCLQSAVLAASSSGRPFIAYSQWLLHSLVPAVQASSRIQENGQPSSNSHSTQDDVLPAPALPLAQDAIRWALIWLSFHL